jgi:probable F420-dependent oxidoreductase
MSPTNARPFRFGVQANNAPDREAWAGLARRAESFGYSTLTMPDHFSDQLAPVPALMAAADATTTLRVGALVFDNDYKHPVVLAKELATIDVLSEGRLEIGIGAGWQRTDYEASGIHYDSPGLRVDRFVEGLAVVKGLLSGEPFSFHGDHYAIKSLSGRPLPVQRPHPPILIGGGGRRDLRIAAREADIVGVNATLTAGAISREALDSMSAEAVDAKVAIVREAAGGRDIEMSVRTFFVAVTNDRNKAADDIAAMIGLQREAVLASPFALVGTARQIADDLLARRETWGFSYVLVGPENVEEFAPVVAELAGT